MGVGGGLSGQSGVSSAAWSGLWSRSMRGFRAAMLGAAGVGLAALLAILGFSIAVYYGVSARAESSPAPAAQGVSAAGVVAPVSAPDLQKLWKRKWTHRSRAKSF